MSTRPRLPESPSHFARPPSLWARLLYAVVRNIAVGLARLYFPGRVIGAENIPATGAFLVAPVHRSYVDWLIVARVSRRRLRYIVKEEVWKSKVAGRLLDALGAFPVNRSGADREALERCCAVLQAGDPLVMFPEGTRRSGQKVEDLRDGVAYLSIRTGVPVVPVGVGGTERAMPRGSRLPRPSRVCIVVGAPVIPPATAAGGSPRSAREGAVAGSSRRSPRVARSATSAVSEQLRESLQEAFDKAEASLRP